ncbi:ATP-dependent DNA ligase [Streptomyces coryli]|nr:ATP-dependent DNA ligase [Streptomyces coryli]
MLAAPVDELVLPPHFVAEPKWDGIRALVAIWPNGLVLVRSRHGTDMTKAFPEIAAAARADLPGDVLLDGELISWRDGRLSFADLPPRLNRSAATAARLAAAAPAHFVAFDLLHWGEDMTARPYAERRAALEELFADYRLGGTWALCPASSELADAEEWLTWSVVGLEGVVIKDERAAYRPGARGWRKYRVRHSAEAIIGAVTGRLTRPSSLLLGRYDEGGRLRYTGRTTPLSTAAAEQLTAALAPAPDDHPWVGRSFSAGWGSSEQLHPTLVAPELVAEVSVDVSVDAGRWRHPVRLLRLRPDLTPGKVPLFGADHAS